MAIKVYPTKRSKMGQLRDRIAEIDAHKASFVAGAVSTALDILLAIAALFPVYLHDKFKALIEKYALISGHDKSNSPIVFLTAMPIIAAVFSVLLMIGNRMKIWITYPLFLLFNSTLMLWNIFLVLIIYTEAIPGLKSTDDKQENFSSSIKKIHLYSAFLIITIFAQILLNFIVFRGWRVLKSSMDD